MKAINGPTRPVTLILILGLLTVSTAASATCLAGYESLCSELQAPSKRGGVGSEGGTGVIGQQRQDSIIDENSDFNITHHGSRIFPDDESVK